MLLVPARLLTREKIHVFMLEVDLFPAGTAVKEYGLS